MFTACNKTCCLNDLRRARKKIHLWCVARSSSTATILCSKSQAAAIVFYGASSFLIVVLNKIVLTNFEFSAALFLAGCNQLVGVLLVRILHLVGVTTFDMRDNATAQSALPLAMAFALDTVLGMMGGLPLYATCCNTRSLVRSSRAGC
jgi:hypothetical protein